jgi:hypothetical protein
MRADHFKNDAMLSNIIVALIEFSVFKVDLYARSFITPGIVGIPMANSS